MAHLIENPIFWFIVVCSILIAITVCVGVGVGLHIRKSSRKGGDQQTGTTTNQYLELVTEFCDKLDVANPMDMDELFKIYLEVVELRKDLKTRNVPMLVRRYCEALLVNTVAIMKRALLGKDPISFDCESLGADAILSYKVDAQLKPAYSCSPQLNNWVRASLVRKGKLRGGWCLTFPESSKRNHSTFVCDGTLITVTDLAFKMTDV